MSALLGREQDLASLDALVSAGSVVVIFGPIGVGKTALLHALDRRVRQRDLPCGFIQRTEALSDFTQALARAYPRVVTSGTQRQLRGRLRMAVERRPGVLLFDGLGRTGTAFKGAVRSVRGTGLGVVFAADVDHPRDHQRIRALGLSSHEVELRPLHGNSMRALLQALLEERALTGRLTPAHLRALVAATEGLPGRAIDFADALVDPAAWSAGAPRIDWLRTGAVISAAERYRQPLKDWSPKREE
ncbi:MAG TPA: ATP-binding protein [Casimicrobiaceae bacterium]|nr:ATP-binding protein [Casimicrobiaceae bacterium]